MARDAGPSNAPPDASAPPLPAVTLPEGGGAIRSLGETFTANPATGTASLSIPIWYEPRVVGVFDPQTTLTYDSGSSNGPFGFGWILSLPTISRRTDRGVPRYEDADESDALPPALRRR